MFQFSLSTSKNERCGYSALCILTALVLGKYWQLLLEEELNSFEKSHPKIQIDDSRLCTAGLLQGDSAELPAA